MDIRHVSRIEQLAGIWFGRAVAWFLIAVGLGVYGTFAEPWAEVWARWLT